MSKNTDSSLPWAMPMETVEAIELMRETAEIIRNTAQFASLRKELRDRLVMQATKLDELARQIDQPIVDSALMYGIDTVARDKKSHSYLEIVEALEKHISAHNRKK